MHWKRLFRLALIVVAVSVSCACVQPLLVSSLVYRVHRGHRQDGYYHAIQYIGIASSMTTPLLLPLYSESSSSSTATSEATTNQRVVDDESIEGECCTDSNQNSAESSDRDITSSIATTNRFIIDSTSPSVSIEEVSNDNLIMIVNLETTDEECNQLCWYYMLICICNIQCSNQHYYMLTCYCKLYIIVVSDISFTLSELLLLLLHII